MSDYLTGTYIPIKTAGELEFQQQYDALGLGKMGIEAAMDEREKF